ncbi:hypothetical protein HA402_014760 [Bradysia odoriphaga]|nr:hypothetical protein HA402_014760 [Bradysia odoriphaga]
MYSIGKAHKNYSADIAWLPSSQSILYSVGGTTMKVFDTRQNVTLSVTDHAYSYSTLAISPCEKYCCVGDVKGTIVSYDIRNIRTALQMNNCHDGIITSLRFLPCPLEAELSSDDILHEDHSEADSIDRKKPDKRRNSAQMFFDLIAPVKHSGSETETDSLKQKKSSTRRTSAQDFFDVVAPVQQRKEKSSPSGDVFGKRSSDPSKSKDLMSVPEENTTTDSSHSNHQTSAEEDGEVRPSTVKFTNKRHTINTLTGREFLGSDNVFRSPNCSTPQDHLMYKNSIKSQNGYTATDMNDMEEKMHDLEIRMNEKLSNMQRKFDEKLEEMNDVIVHGFRSIHCNLWTMAETDVRDTKDMVAKIFENYSQISDVFIENLRLKEHIVQLQQRDAGNNSPRDIPMDSDSV